MSETAAPSAEIHALVGQRQRARADKDWALSDALRDQIAAAGWIVTDTADGPVLTPAPPFPLCASVDALPDRTASPDGRRASVGIIVDGWPDDVRTFVDAVLAHTPDEIKVLALDVGNVDAAGLVVHELATAHPDRVEAFHLAGTLGWAQARTALLRLDPAPSHIVADLSSVLDGDAITPLLDALDADPTVVAAGWKGALVDVDDQWRSVRDAGPGEVDVLLSYLVAVRRDAALTTPPHPKARFYRNADLEWSLALREAGGRLVVPTSDLPVHQERHRGYHDSDPELRERESKRTYDRLLQRFRGRTEILTPRT